jgi:hypothetical protein
VARRAAHGGVGVILSFLFPDDGNMVILVDDEGIDWLERGLDAVRGSEPGHEWSSPSLSEDGVAELILRRAADADPS